MIKLHLGCGERFLPGFIHIDVRKFSHIDYVTNVDNLDMFKDNSVDLIYNACLLEHIKRQKLPDILKEWHRTLKFGGILRVSVPDFNQIVKAYFKYKNLELFYGLLLGKQDYPENVHHNVFDFKTLKKVLKRTGFKNIRRYDWKKTIHRDYDDYSQAYIPHLDKKKGILMSLNIEAEKR